MRGKDAAALRMGVVLVGLARFAAAAAATPPGIECGAISGAPGSSARCDGDADGDGVVNFQDVTTILSNWGATSSLAEQRERLMGERYITGDIAITILGDSTNNPNQGITFVPDHYGILARRSGNICGFGIGTTNGGARLGGNAFIAVAGGGSTNYVGDVQDTVLPPSASASSGAERVPAGDHADWKVKKAFDGEGENGEISNIGPTYRIDIRNIAGLFPARGDWLAGGRGKIRIPFLRHPEGVPGCVGELNLQTFEDFDGNGVYSAALSAVNVQIAGSETGLVAYDSDVGGAGITPSGRIRFEIRGRAPNGSESYAGKSVLFGSPIIFNADAVENGFYLDTLSIGGWTVAKHLANTTEEELADWRSIQPRAAEYFWIYLGQNDIYIDEVWESQFIALGERAEAAGYLPVMVVPASVSEFSEGKAVLMREVFGRLREKKGWPVLDIDMRLGRRLGGAELFDQIHRTMQGALVIADTIQAVMKGYACAGPAPIGDADADGVVNIQDITVALSSWGATCP